MTPTPTPPLGVPQLLSDERLAEMPDALLLEYASNVVPGSDEHYDAIMEICNRGLKDPEAGSTACNYLPELKANLQTRPRLGVSLLEQFRLQVAQELAGLREKLITEHLRLQAEANALVASMAELRADALQQAALQNQFLCGNMQGITYAISVLGATPEGGKP